MGQLLPLLIFISNLPELAFNATLYTVLMDNLIAWQEIKCHFSNNKPSV